MPSAPSPCLEAALTYLNMGDKGWSVLPLCSGDHRGMTGQHEKDCRSPGKAPLCPWKSYQDRVARPVEAKLWWNRWPTANVGMALGPVSGLIGLDIDGSAGEFLLSLLMRQADVTTLPPTLEFATPGGGRRLLFKCPDVELTNEEYQLGDGELRVLCKGRQTVMPPSRHANGGEYVWVEGHRPREIEPAELPEWLLNLLQGNANGTRRSGDERWNPCNDRPGDAHDSDRGTSRASQVEPDAHRSQRRVGTGDPSYLERVASATRYLRKCDPAISGQGGHNKTIKIAIHTVRGFNLDPETALSLLLAEYNQRCEPPWSEKELRHKVEAAVKAKLKGGKQDGYLLDEPSPVTRNGEPVAPARPVHAEAATSRAQAKPPPPSIKPQLITADALMAQEFPSPRWAVDGILPEGATIIAGRPKTGKSWMVLNLALAVASGGVALGKTPVQQGTVLYLALEDGPRRLQRRLRKILDSQNGTATDRLHLSTVWPRSSDGGIDHLNAWLDATPDARLVIIDTLARIRDKRRGGDTGIYEEDYHAIAMLQTLAQQRGVAVVIVHHTRKSVGEDPLDDVSGTLGLTGAADVVLVLKRARYAKEGTLFVTGRDVDEKELSLLWDPAYCLWTQTDRPGDNDPEAHLSADQRRVRAILREAGRPLGLLDINAKLRKEYSATATIVHRMAKDGLLKKAGYGAYALPDETPIPE